MSGLINKQEVMIALEKVAGFFPYEVHGDRDSYSQYTGAWHDAIGRAEMEIENLPSVEPKTGKWIPCDVDSRGMTNMFVCSKCGSFTSLPILRYANAMEYDFCPHCGAKMEDE